MKAIVGLTSLALYLTFMSCAGSNVLTKSIHADPYLKSITSNPDYEVQILYTHVDRKNKRFKTYSYHVDETKYFYPASTVKMPVAILSLQKINDLNSQGIDLTKDDIMMTAAINERLTLAFKDTTTVNNKPNIGRYIEKIFAISDNDAYNRLFEWLGQDYINGQLISKNIFHGSVINHRLSIPNLTSEENRQSNEIRFFRDDKILYEQASFAASQDWKHHADFAQKGLGYYNSNDSLIMKPFDFSRKNFYTIRDMEATLQRIIFPEYFPENQRFNLTDSNYYFLKKCMSSLPRDYHFLKNEMYHDSYVKFLMYGNMKTEIPQNIKIYNKVGDAYGYLIDCAYIEDTDADIGFFLTAVIHVNADKIYNDNKYEYNETGLPFLAKLGQTIYKYELEISKKTEKMIKNPFQN